MDEHKHCKRCGEVIKDTYDGLKGTMNDMYAYKLSICVDCIFETGLRNEKLKQKEKK